MTARVLILGTADWTQPIATNQHYVTNEIAKYQDVVFCESLGLRRPTFSMSDIQRVLRRVKILRSPSREAIRDIPTRVTVVTPHVVPLHNFVFRRFNRRQLMLACEPWLQAPGRKVLITYSPLTYGLERLATSTIYHCVDLLATVQGINAKLIHREERRLARTASVAIGSSENVARHLENERFKDVRLLPNVADTTLFSRARASPARMLRRAVFAGNLTIAKIDFTLLSRVIDEGWELHLAGPVADLNGVSGRAVRGLVSKGAVYHGLLSLDALADLYWTASVGLIPYRLNEYTAGVSPLKTYEYLAAGLCVLSSSIPTMATIADDVDILAFDSDDNMAALLRSRDWAVTDLALRRRQKMASLHSWFSRGQEFRRLVEEQLDVSS